MTALTRLARFVVFAGYFARELVLANLQVVWDVLTPRSRLSPGIVALPLRSRTAGEITLLANLVSLTPGTLSLAVGRDPDTLYVHGMYAGTREEFVRQLEEMEDRMLHAWRGRAADDDVDRHRPAVADGRGGAR
ncbi:Na+/H+ antiporter subunit E [Trujillonella humicola]|uniref:Na+/H+ antiporter subunit E n=1 Tax=Trujillonella humicola TaxID=3383699 RepID=UPI0039061B31